jgi:hypothetical protein
MTIGHGFPSANQPDNQQISPIKGQIVIYRTNLGPDWFWESFGATIVGNGGEPSGESR